MIKKLQNSLDIYLEYGNTFNLKIQCNMTVIVIKLVHVFTNNITSWFIRDYMVQIKLHKFKVVA